MLHPLTSQLVGSYAKPLWLVDPQRVRGVDNAWWRPAPDVLGDAQDDAVRLAIYEQERAGMDLVTDGEERRGSYDRHFLPVLSGLDIDRLERVALVGPSEVSTVTRRNEGWEEYTAVTSMGPAVVGPIRWQRPAAADEVRYAVAHATGPVKATVIGPLTLSRSLADHQYGSEEALILALADALHHECRALEEAGAAVIQIDEPTFHGRYSVAARVGHEALGRMVHGLSVPVQVHVCYGYAMVVKDKSPSAHYADVLALLAASPVQGISLEYEQPGHGPEILAACGDKHVILGLLDLGRREAETADHIEARLRAALAVVPAARLHPSSDCGLWHLPRPLAFAKMAALGEATRRVRG